MRFWVQNFVLLSRQIFIFAKIIDMNIAVILVLCLLPILLFLDWSKPFRDKYPDTFGYILSLVGTFVGIVLGLYFTEIQNNKSSKQATIKILEASREEMEWLIKRCEVMTKTIDTLPNRKRDKFLQLELPPFFSETIRSQIIVEMLQPSTIEQFNIIKENILFDNKMLKIDFAKKNQQQIEFDTNDYKNQLKTTITIIDNEIKLLSGKVDLADFEKQSKKKLMILMND